MQSISKIPSFIFLFLFSLCYLAGDSAALLAQDLATVIEEAEKSLVSIQVKGLEGGGLGSGYVISADGLVVTNVHVMAGAQKAYVSFPNGRQFEISGTTHIDEARDICIVKLKDANDLQPIKLAAKLPRKGETVTALGSPLGLSFTATNGIVSAIRDAKDLGRDIGDATMKGSWVQVDAALSPGNSGGPLINAKGEVVAMSTRASQGGVAQNLNFGISIKDINEAIATAASAKQTSLVAGVGKIKDHEVAGGTPEPGELVGKRDVPDSALAGYIQEGREDFKELSKRVRKEASEQEEIYRLMRKGETGIPSSFRPGPNTAYMTTKGRTKVKYYFRSDATKRKFVSKKGERVSKLKALKKTLADSTPEAALAALLQDAGPPLDPQSPYSAGFLEGAVVLHAFNDHEIAIAYDDSPFLMWVESTAGLSTGQELAPTVAYVAGTETMQIPGESTMSVTVLQVVTERRLDKALVAAGIAKVPNESGIAGPGPDGFMLWQSKSGQYSIEAKFIRKEGTNVHLKCRDGSELKVPIEKLHEDCLKYAK